MDGSFIFFYFVVEKKELYIGYLLYVCKCKKGLFIFLFFFLEGYIKINDNFELYRFVKKGYIVSCGLFLVIVKS